MLREIPAGCIVVIRKNFCPDMRLLAVKRRSQHNRKRMNQ
jgi:hypothetical protein